jgi:hypothetical protein
MPTFVVMLDVKALKVNTCTGIEWVSDARKANTYSSKYQAKRHLKQLDNVPGNVKIVELLNQNE